MAVPAAAERVTLQPSGRLGVDLASTNITDLEVLQGFPIEALDLTATAIGDLSALEGMPLRSLKLGNTEVADLSSLQGLPLEILDASHIPATDFTPLSQIPSLIELHLTGTEIANLEGLRSLSVLQRLNLRNCLHVENYEALAHLPGLTHLRLPSGLADVNDEAVETLQALRASNSLRKIASTSDAVEWDYEAVDGFWNRYDQIGVASTLTKVFAGTSFIRRPDWTWFVALKSRPNDLAALRALPVSELWITHMPIDDLSSLEGLPLRLLRLLNTEVKDLRPLGGLPLEIITIHSDHEVDVAPLASISTLSQISLPEKALNVEALRGLPRLNSATRRGIDDYLRLKENPTQPE